MSKGKGKERPAWPENYSKKTLLSLENRFLINIIVDTARTAPPIPHLIANFASKVLTKSAEGVDFTVFRLILTKRLITGARTTPFVWSWNRETQKWSHRYTLLLFYMTAKRNIHETPHQHITQIPVWRSGYHRP